MIRREAQKEKQKLEEERIIKRPYWRQRQKECRQRRKLAAPVQSGSGITVQSVKRCIDFGSTQVPSPHQQDSDDEDYTSNSTPRKARECGYQQSQGNGYVSWGWMDESGL